MTVRRENVQSSFAKKKFLHLQQHANKQTEDFTSSYNTYSLSSMGEKFSQMSSVAQKKIVSRLTDEQLYVLGVCVQFPGEVKNHIIGLLFNGHNSTAQMYCELPLFDMVETSIRMEMFKQNYPLTITGEYANVPLSYEHYVHLTKEDLDCLMSALVKQETIENRETCVGALRVIKSIEEDKMKQCKLSQQTQLTQALISRPFLYTVSLQEDENGVKKIACNSGDTVPGLCADWMLSSSRDADLLTKKIFRENKWNDVKSHLEKERQNKFQFKGDVTVRLPLFTWLCNSFGWSSPVPAAGTVPKWGIRPLSVSIIAKVMRLVVANLGLGGIPTLIVDETIKYGECTGYCVFVLEFLNSVIHHNFSSQSIDLNELVK